MRAKPLREIRRSLGAARTAYAREIERIAELARDQLVPYFQKRGWSYMAGNGTWYIEDRRKRDIRTSATISYPQSSETCCA